MEIATAETAEVETPTKVPSALPKWYTEAPIEDSERGRLMDEVRTALLDYPEPGDIERLAYACILVWLNEPRAFQVAKHLENKGLNIGAQGLKTYERKTYCFSVAVFSA